jgi:hypothetical protein
MLQFFKENLTRQSQFLGLWVGFFALLMINMAVAEQFGYPLSTYLGAYLATIFQIWVTIKYIMKK